MRILHDPRAPDRRARSKLSVAAYGDAGAVGAGFDWRSATQNSAVNARVELRGFEVTCESSEVVWLHEPIDYRQSNHLIRGVLDQGILAVLYGPSGSGKTYAAVDIGFGVATGTHWRGREVTKGLVLHIAGEGARGLRLRQAAYCKHYGVPKTAPYAVLPKAIEFSPGPDHELIAIVGEASRHINEPPRLVIVDTLARCIVGDENSSQDMANFIRACDYVRSATGATVLVVHHSGKDSTKGARGHSSLRAACDTELECEGSGNPRMLYVRKQRDMELAAPMSFDLEPVTLSVELDGTNVTACVVKHSVHAPARARPSGKQQAGLLAELEKRYKSGEVVWTDAELRAIARTLDMHKNSARSAVLGLESAGYFGQSVGGMTLKYPPEARP